MKNIIKNQSIVRKLTLASSAVAFGLVLVGAAYVYGWQAQNALDTEVAQNEQQYLVLSQLKDGVNAARIAADDFFSKTGGQEQFDNLKQALSVASTRINALKAQELELGEQALVKQSGGVYQGFQQTADQAINTKIEIGMNQELGLRGAARNAVNNIEKKLKTITEENQSSTADPKTQLQVEKLQVSMLMMRRHEKDFLEREDANYIERLTKERANFETLLNRSSLSTANKTEIQTLLDSYAKSFLALAETTLRFNKLLNDLGQMQRALFSLANDGQQASLRYLGEVRAKADAQKNMLNIVFGVLLAVIAAGLILALSLVSRGLARSLRQLSQTVQQVTEGNLDARAQMPGNDELAQLGAAFDAMLDQRVAYLAQAEKENTQLNDSVIKLMDAAERLSKRDLTVVVPVGADITGNVSDALNVMTRQTARTMADINNVAGQLERVVNAVRQQGDKVAGVAANERHVVAKALVSLEQSAATMAEMAQIAATTNALAGNASDSSKKALGAVRTTVQSMGEIRNSVGEAEKSIKRLGERSQEVGAIVQIIKDIAERTHTLALNAGMQAVAAGEAGRGFSVVADEVQRLAETARESTNQITALVNSIQSESSESMATMNKTISQVVSGSELAERAGKRMRLTQKATEELVGSVGQIADRSKLLEATNLELREQANALQKSTEATEQELQAQTEQTNTLVKFLQNLVQSVRVFKLPEAA